MRWYFLVFGIINAMTLLIALVLSLNVIGDYFSYFTVLSNILISFVFVSIGVLGVKKTKKSNLLKFLYGPAVLFMCMTGIIYWTILHGGKHLTTDVEWITLVLHGLTPIIVFLGWMVFRPFTYSIKDVALWLLFPLVFVLYTLLRGLLVGNWYPYPFLNPTIYGYVGVGEWTIGILFGSFVLGNILRILPKIK